MSGKVYASYIMFLVHIWSWRFENWRIIKSEIEWKYVEMSSNSQILYKEQNLNNAFIWEQTLMNCFCKPRVELIYFKKYLYLSIM